MGPSNKEIQMRTTCQLYAYVLESLGKEISEDVQDCADSYDFPVNCVEELAQELKNLDSDTLNNISNKKDSEEAYALRNWWKMYQEMEKLHSDPDSFV